MAKRGRKSHNIRGKAIPIPHNNRAETGGRKVRKQLIIMDEPDETGSKKKTIFHYNYSKYQQGRIHLIKKALEEDDTDILKAHSGGLKVTAQFSQFQRHFKLFQRIIYSAGGTIECPEAVADRGLLENLVLPDC